jgi:hypothetical protein
MCNIGVYGSIKPFCASKKGHVTHVTHEFGPRRVQIQNIRFAGIEKCLQNDKYVILANLILVHARLDIGFKCNMCNMG